MNASYVIKGGDGGWTYGTNPFAFGCELQNHRYPKLTNELRNRNIVRVCMENLSIVI